MFPGARSALPGMALAVLLTGPLLPHAAHADDTVRMAAAQTRPETAPSAPVITDSNLETVWRQAGVASWYGGKRWQGRRTASGARYDERLLTAAHATLPIGTKVRVTLEGSDRSVIVVINDRPGTRSRIIDLSRQAAADLGILSKGVAVVSLTALHGG